MVHLAELLKVREITIDTMQYKDFATKEEELKVMRFYQNDLNSAKLLINVTHDKVVTDFSTATKVQVAFQKPDGKRVFQDVQNVNQMQGKYYVVLSTQTLIAYGNVVAQLRLTFPNNKVIETCKFVFAVDESIMSDNAMESTNEFPVIQKAIEAGKKLEGKDIDGIIAAGAKADAALPKTGGTMTGDLVIKKDNTGFQVKNNGDVGLSHLVGATGEYYWYSTTGKTPLKYNVATDTFTLTAVNSNLIKSTGDTMSGPMTFDAPFTVRGSAASWDMRPYAAGAYSKGVRHTINTTNNFYAIAPTDAAGSGQWANQVALYGDTGVWDVKDINVRGGSASNVVTKLKDGRSTLTLTSDATNADTGNPPSVVRRGNTVTTRFKISRNVGSSSARVTTLPIDMRPTDYLEFNTIADDGSVVKITIGTAGGVDMFTTGKTVAFVGTFAID
ncbi:BppU family phage baseplate upper protein [Bacillus mycoides]